MDSSYRIVPANPTKSASIQDTANSLGLHDTLQYGPRSLATEIQSRSSLQHRLEKWDETQDNTKLTMLRKTQGLHAPMRLLMERKLVSFNPHMPTMPQSNLHLDILMGRDETIEPADVLGGMEQSPPLDIHREFEKMFKM